METILDGIRHQADKANIDIIIQPVFEEDELDYDHNKSSAFVQNMESGRFGVVSDHIEDRNPDTVCTFTFHPKMYEYGKAEGFSKSECFKAFPDNILKENTLKEFIEFILSDETYD